MGRIHVPCSGELLMIFTIPNPVSLPSAEVKASCVSPDKPSTQASKYFPKVEIVINVDLGARHTILTYAGPSPLGWPSAPVR